MSGSPVILFKLQESKTKQVISFPPMFSRGAHPPRHIHAQKQTKGKPIAKKRTDMSEIFYKEWLKPENLAIVAGWRRKGLNITEIANKIGVRDCTLHEWKKKYPAFKKAMETSRDIADTAVESALFKSAVGFEYTEEVYERQYDKSAREYRMVLVRQTKKTVPPSLGAMCFWLKNRAKNRWKDHPEAETDQETLKKVDDILSALTIAADAADPEGGKE